MSVRNQLRLLLGGLGAGRSARPEAHSAMGDFLERSRLVAFLIFLVTVAAIVVISSAGLTTLDAPLLPNQIATTRVSAQASFEFESAERTRATREQLRTRVPPVYKLDTEPLRRFEAASRMLLAQIAAFEKAHPGPVEPLLQFRSELAAIAETFNSHGSYHATPEDVAAVLAAGDATARAAIFENGLATLRDLYAQGVADSSLGVSNPGSALAFELARQGGGFAQRPVQSMEDALTILRVSLGPDPASRASTQAVFRLFRFGLSPNLVFDRDSTTGRQEAAAKAVRPVKVSVARGQALVEAGDRVTPDVYESLVAHRRFLREHAEVDTEEGLTLFGRVLLVLAMVIASLIYIRIEDPGASRNHCEIVLGQPAILRDLKSTNGTLLNGARVEQGELADGAVITIGTTQLVFRSG